jgi:hypothetical protein
VTGFERGMDGIIRFRCRTFDLRIHFTHVEDVVAI